MVFSSLIFLFVFFTANLIVYFAVSPQKRNKVLLIFSLVFYAWGGPRYLLLLAGETLVSWIFALKISEARAGYTKRTEKFYLVCDLVIMLACLAVFKYLGFFIGNFKAIFGVPKAVPQIVLPIGISFYTFQLISYVVDVYRNQVKPQKEYWKLLLYSSLFHQCIAGPIVRYETVADEIDNREITANDIYMGVRRFTVGLAKKAVLANSCASIADTLLPAGVASLKAQTTLGMWLGMIAYMLQIYLDFSAYSDMAIGMGRMVGFHYDENFNYPYMATSVNNFWRRWHITLGRALSTYVYKPLGGNRKGRVKTYINLLLTFLVSGLWHGAAWTFVFWGLLHGIASVIDRLFRDNNWKINKYVSWILTFMFVNCAWVFFRATTFERAFEILTAMFSVPSGDVLNMAGIITNGSIIIIGLVYILLVISLVVTLSFKNTYELAETFDYTTINTVYVVILMVVGISFMPRISPFIYFNF